MNWIFTIKDKSGRKIYLSKEAWQHINQQHPEIVGYLEEIKETLKNPVKITTYGFDGDIKYYYKYFKNRKSSAKFLLVIVKYLNDKGFIITSYFIRNIK